jgi:hypothetical protein
MRPHVRSVRQPLADEEPESTSSQGRLHGGNDMDNVVQKITFEIVTLEERRREARKPLYLVRYE